MVLGAPVDSAGIYPRVHFMLMGKYGRDGVLQINHIGSGEIGLHYNSFDKILVFGSRLTHLCFEFRSERIILMYDIFEIYLVII